jgi:hypothetical protein
MRETSFQEPALPKHFQDEFLEREIRRGAHMSELVLAAVRFNAFTEFPELGPICGEQ